MDNVGSRELGLRELGIGCLLGKAILRPDAQQGFLAEAKLTMALGSLWHGKEGGWVPLLSSG